MFDFQDALLSIKGGDSGTFDRDFAYNLASTIEFSNRIGFNRNAGSGHLSVRGSVPGSQIALRPCRRIC